MELDRQQPRGAFTDTTWAVFHTRWKRGDYRASFFRDMILVDALRPGPRPTLLDIGCGTGLDGRADLQRSLRVAAGRYVGVEPDPAVAVGPHFTEVHRCPLEEAPLAPGSIDVAYASFVLEHLRWPAAFWAKLFDVLVDGGAFWGFTIDVRHLFGLASMAVQNLGLKERYLDLVRGARASHRRETYPTFYRANSPQAIRRHAGRFRSVRMMNLHQTGQFDAYLPPRFHGAAHLVDRLTAALGLPGPMLVVRLEK